ncbi:HlyD family secretion protein [Dechloromonas denitrificans]|uniref:HlyD family secretion protein n=1 Tax=Dechloromonas denitrificans TaxID=281362 RepID=UPI001CFA4357|nr:HlyD family efflux transporter periplasmic adaptor subunit [Dechloromonas denitrificans]UCV06978.1 efflux RND transporter periplasmic adaptor subunit [Dechloromonas denitrificans]
MSRTSPGKILLLVLVLACAAGLAFYLYLQRPAGLPAGLASGNGRLEAIEVDVATKIAGRLSELVPREGDMVEAGAVVARLDADDLRAQLRATEAQVEQARQAVDETRSAVRKSASDVSLADKSLKRSENLVGRGFITRDKLDRDQTGLEGARASMAQARSRVGEADAAVVAAEAKVDSLKVTLNDTALKAPINGRVLYRLAEPGEVLAAGGKALTLLDLSDMYMTIYLPTDKAGQVALNSEARIILDALPGQAIPATVNFVAPKAQFTPREVETRTEREKLMFRIKVKADPAWLAAHRDLAKGGMPGVAYVRLDANTPWPANLQISGK